MRAGVRPKNKPVLPQVLLFSLFNKGKKKKHRIQDNREQLFAFSHGALPWQPGKMCKIIISWS